MLARDRVAQVLPPVALVVAVSAAVTLLHVCLLLHGVYLPIQLPIFAIAWARGVVSIQVLKVRYPFPCQPRAGLFGARHPPPFGLGYPGTVKSGSLTPHALSEP